MITSVFIQAVDIDENISESTLLNSDGFYCTLKLSFA